MSLELQGSQNLELDTELWINWSHALNKKFHVICPHVSEFLLFLYRRRSLLCINGGN